MKQYKNILGVVLAGGRSSRMGQNKALLDFKGQPLIEHMVAILKNTGIEAIKISGSVDGYDCEPDNVEFNGPAKAINTMMQRFPDYEGFVFIPVDMPFLKPEMLKILLQCSKGGYFLNNPLPAYIAQPYSKNAETSVQNLLGHLGVSPVDLPEQYLSFMMNINTPKEWKESCTL